MDNLLLYALGAATVAAVVTNLLVPTVTRLAIALRAVDYPGGRKLQPGAVPRLGGIAIAGGLALGGGAALVAQWVQWSAHLARREVVAVMLGAALVFVVGVVDDLMGVAPGKKFLIEFFAAWLLVRLGWSFQVMRLPGLGEIDLGLFGGFVSLLWIVGVTNAINLIDGLDGLAGGVVAIISGSLLCYSILQGNPGTVVLMAATA